MEIEHCTPRMHTGNGEVKRSIQTLKNSILTNIKDGQNLTESINRALRSNCSEMNISTPSRPKIPIYVDRDADEEITNYIIMTRNNTEEKQLNEGPESPKKKNSVRYPFYFVEKNYNKKSLEGRFQKKLQKGINETESSVTTATGKILNRKFISIPLFRPNE